MLLKIAKKYILIGKKSKIIFIKDRPGHDLRYALNSSKIKKEIGWRSRIKLSQGLENTFKWYLNNKQYFKSIRKKDIINRLGKND